MHSLLFAAKITVEIEFEIHRDRALYAVAFCSTMRGIGLSNLKIENCLRWPNGEGITLNFQFDKNFRGQHNLAFGIRKNTDWGSFCAMELLDRYADFCISMGLNMRVGLLPFFLIPGFNQYADLTKIKGGGG